ncbi:hypothetical protein OIV83_002734 [Microbotryomycetes sp. JL201]|nr:hypothetical protein OIV83_002734 [Microbotryomycetes sp. JL201]
MARFGLSDSESESSTDGRRASSSTSAAAAASERPSPSPSTSSAAQHQHRPVTRSRRQQQQQRTTRQSKLKRAEDAAEAPPRASLAYSDEDNDDEDNTPQMDQDSDQEDMSDHDRTQSSGMDEDEDEDESLNSVDGDDDNEQLDETGSTSTRSTSSSSQHVTAHRPGPRLPQPWGPKTLNLEPKRVAVMQASFFQQPQVLQTGATVKPDAALPVRNPFQNTSNLPEHASSSFMATRPAHSPQVNAPVAAPPIDPTPFRQLREYERVPLSRSVTHNRQGDLVDLGLAFGRSFKPSWGPHGEIVHFGALYQSKAQNKANELMVEQLKTTQSFNVQLAEETLHLQLQHTLIEVDQNSSAPVATPDDNLRFHHFASSLPNSDRSTEAHLWRLGHALFDEIADLDLPLPTDSAATDSTTARYIESLRRRGRLEAWLADVVRTDVEEDLRSIGGSISEQSSASAGAKRVFALLTGHQIERACEAAGDAGDLRLATLVAQAGGDDDFREDVFLQLAKWREYRVDSHIDPALRRVYELLCGNLGVSEGRAKGDVVDDVAEFHVAEGLDWKRAFGLHLWYGTFQTSVATAVERYEAASSLAADRVAPPNPEYVLQSTSKAEDSETRWRNLDRETGPSDPLFQLIKLFTSSTHSLEEALLPRNFSSSPLDYRLPWHLYILFSRVLRKRDFEDRVIVGAEQGSDDAMNDGNIEGNSVRADMMTESYATQLELAGLWQWSVFILLHLELPAGRETAIRQMLTRHAAELDDDVKFGFLVDTLHVPATWIYSAQATYEHYRGNVFAEFKLLIMAEQWSAAHEIAVLELAPEAVVRGDLLLVKKLLEPFNPRRISAQKSTSTAASTTRSLVLKTIDSVQKLATTSRSYHNSKFKLAMTEMLSRLTVVSKSVDEYLTRIRPSSLQDSDRLVWVRGMNSNFLDKALESAMA